MTTTRTPDLTAVRPHAKALVDHLRGDEHDPYLCALCLRASALDRQTADSQELGRVINALGGPNGITPYQRVRDIMCERDRLRGDLNDQAALTTEARLVARKVMHDGADHTFVGRVAQLPCVHGRARQDGPCAAYERPPVTVASADLAIDLLCCPPCAARRLMADAEAARAPAAPTIRCANSYEGGGVLITDEELARLARGDT